MKHLDSFGEWRTSASRRAEDVDDREIVINRVRDEWNQRETFHADEESCSFLQYHLYVFVFLFSPFCRYCAYLRSARALYTEKRAFARLMTLAVALLKNTLHHLCSRKRFKDSSCWKKSWRSRDICRRKLNLGRAPWKYISVFSVC